MKNKDIFTQNNIEIYKKKYKKITGAPTQNNKQILIKNTLKIFQYCFG